MRFQWQFPPVVGWASAIDESASNMFSNKWDHVGGMYYLTENETERPEIWQERNLDTANKFKEHHISQYIAGNRLEQYKKWGSDHFMTNYARKIAEVCFNMDISCP